MQAKATDILTSKIGNLKFPRVRSDYKFECKPIYTNVNTSQTGVTSQTFVRDQIVISNVNFDPITVQEYKALAQAMNIGTGTGGSFSLTYFNFITGKEETGTFIVKTCPVTILTVTENTQKIRMDAITFQEV